MFAFVKKEGLQICQERKDKQQTSKFRFGETMGSICEQYGYHRLTPPSREKQKLNKQKNLLIHDHNIKIKKFQKGFPIHTIQKIKKFKQPNKKEKIICLNCKRQGHKSTECK